MNFAALLPPIENAFNEYFAQMKVQLEKNIASNLNIVKHKQQYLNELRNNGELLYEIQHLWFELECMKFPFEDYKLDIGTQSLGSGAFSSVYSGSFNGIPAAIKQIPIEKYQQIAQYIAQEVYILKYVFLLNNNISHFKNASFLAKYYCSRKTDTHVEIVMKLYSNGTLAHMLSKFTYGEKTKYGVCCEVADVLHQLHNHGYVHRDIKPANILVDENYNLVIADCSFVRSSKFKLPTFCGSPFFIAPEIVNGSSTIGPAADVFSFAKMVWLIVTEENMDSFPKTFMNIADTALKQLIQRSVSVDPALRPKLLEFIAYFSSTFETTLKKDMALPLPKNIMLVQNLIDKLFLCTTVLYTEIKLHENDMNPALIYIGKRIKNWHTLDYISSIQIHENDYTPLFKVPKFSLSSIAFFNVQKLAIVNRHEAKIGYFLASYSDTPPELHRYPSNELYVLISLPQCELALVSSGYAVSQVVQYFPQLTHLLLGSHVQFLTSDDILLVSQLQQLVEFKYMGMTTEEQRTEQWKHVLDLKPLQAMPYLQQLCLYGCQVADKSPVQHLKFDFNEKYLFNLNEMGST